jgi:hypothetical protein
MSKFRTLKLKGWTRIIGPGPARQGLGRRSIISKSSHLASFCVCLVKKADTIQENEKLIACHCLKPIRQFYAESAAILLNGVLNVEMGGGIGKATIQNIVNAGRDFEVLEEILAEECEIEDGITAGIGALNGDGLAKGIGGVVE